MLWSMDKELLRIRFAYGKGFIFILKSKSKNLKAVYQIQAADPSAACIYQCALTAHNAVN